jgi:hypothetical protein
LTSCSAGYNFTNSDRLFFIQLYRWFSSVLKAITIIRPKTLVRSHRAGFRRYWRWKSRNLEGRPESTWLKLGFAVAQSTAAKAFSRAAAMSSLAMAAISRTLVEGT